MPQFVNGDFISPYARPIDGTITRVHVKRGRNRREDVPAWNSVCHDLKLMQLLPVVKVKGLLNLATSSAQTN